MADSPHVAIVIPIYNGIQDTLECLDSLTGIDYPAYSIIIVDNASADGSAEAIETWQHENQGSLTLIRNERNLGFTGGCNVGIRHGLAQGADYILLLNNDTVVTHDFLCISKAKAERLVARIPVSNYSGHVKGAV